jgi:DinB superfamily
MMNSQLERIKAEAAANRVVVLEMCAGLTDEKLTWREGPTRWSVAENLVHLAKTVELCTPALDKAIGDARREGKLSEGPFEQGVMGKIFVWYVEPPPKIRLPAPKSLLPKFEGSGTESVEEYLRSQELILERLEAADGVDLRRASFKSPFASFVKMDLLALFSVWTAHERRHIEQMKRVRKNL